MSSEFKFVIDLGGRGKASKRLRRRGVRTATTGNMYNWVRRNSVPSDAMKEVIKIKFEADQSVVPADFELINPSEERGQA